ncbi:MAG: YceD family protein [Gammaproteobacteria bacterium]
MQDRLPESIDAASLMASGKTSGREYRGELSLAGMHRLAEAVRDIDVPDLDIRLYAGRDAGGVLCLEGDITGHLHLTCQRCLDSVDHPVQIRFRLALVNSEAEAERLADGYEPWVLEDERLVIREVIEDELLLALPAFPLHADTEPCAPPEYRHDEFETDAEEKPNPFAALASLKRN